MKSLRRAILPPSLHSPTRKKNHHRFNSNGRKNEGERQFKKRGSGDENDNNKTSFIESYRPKWSEVDKRKGPTDFGYVANDCCNHNCHFLHVVHYGFG